MCSLCNQYVTLANGEQRTYFKHSKAESDKSCSERTLAAGHTASITAGDHTLPIRLTVLNEARFSLTIGVIPIPNALFQSCKSMNLEITPPGIENSKYVHLIGHIANDTVTYLTVGNVPAKNYSLAIHGAETEIYRYWPKNISGINPQGTLFSSATRKMIPAGGEMQLTTISMNWWRSLTAY